MEIINTPNAPQPNGHYAQATVYNNTVYTAVQLGIKPEDTNPTPGTVKEQAEQVLKNLQAVLKAAGSDLSSALRIMIYVTDVKHWEEVNEIYTQILGDHKPARGVVPVTQLHLGFDVGMEVIAEVRDKL